VKRYPAVMVFLAALAAYLSTRHWHGGDDLPSILLPFALLRHGTLALDPFIDDWFRGRNAWFTIAVGARHLSWMPPATGLLALPVCLVPALRGATITVGLLMRLSKLSGALITAASVGVLWKALERRCSRQWAFCLCALYGLGSWAFSVSGQALWQHGPACLTLALGLWGLAEDGPRFDALAGFGFAASAAVRPDDAFFFAAALAYLLYKERRRLPLFLSGALAPAVLSAAYWLHYTGRLRPPELGVQAAKLGGLDPNALLALLVSPTRGLLTFFPAAAFGAWGAWKKRRDALPPLLLAACAAQWVFFACYDGWTGGNTFGARYFAAAALVLTWLCAVIEPEVRGSRALLSLWSLCVSYSAVVHALGAYLPWPGPPDIPEQKLAAWSWSLHPLAALLTTPRALGAASLPARAVAFSAALALAAGGGALLRRGLGRTPGGARDSGLH